MAGGPGCSQKLPPHSVTDRLALQETPRNQIDRNRNPEIKPNTPDAEQNPLVTTFSQETKGTSKVLVSGRAADLLYHSLAIEATAVEGARFKQGLQYSCTESKDAKYACSIEVNFKNLAVAPVVSVESLKLAKPELALEAVSGDPYLMKILNLPKLSLLLPNSLSEILFKAAVMDHSRIYDLGANGDFGAGLHLAGEEVNCLRQVRITDHADLGIKANVPYFSCYLHLDPAQGSIDKVDPNSLY